MIYICQLLCKQRHCMIAVAFDGAATSIADGEQAVNNQWELMVKTGIPARCRICGSEQFHFETGRTRFRTMEEAEPALRKLEALNMAGGAALEMMNKTGVRH